MQSDLTFPLAPRTGAPTLVRFNARPVKRFRTKHGAADFLRAKRAKVRAPAFTARSLGFFATAILTLGATFQLLAAGDAPSALEAGWENPLRDARLRAYWWWLNGNVTSNAITRDLQEMKAKGFGGALICDADGSNQDGNDRVKHGPTFFSPEWRALYKHTLREADRLGLEMSLNIQSGWNLGGPMVTPDDAPKKLVWTEARVTGPTNLSLRLLQAKGRDGFYRDLFVLAWRLNPDRPKDRLPLQNYAQKALLKPLVPFSAPDSAPLFQEFPARAGEEDTRTTDLVDLTGKLSPDGVLRWDVPAGEWEIVRLGCTLNDHCRVSTCSEGWEGYALDPFDAGAFKRYWDAVVEPLIADAGPLAGKTLKYLHTDSWEVEVANWTPTLREEFRKRRGYDLLPWLPVLTGRIVNSRDESNRFLHDFRRTFGDLARDNHYKLFKEGAHKHGLLIHPESGGPHAVPIDAQQCLGFNDAPMSEFWAWSWRHRVGDANRFFVKQPASAAHTYGRKLVLAEGFTTIGPHWQEALWDNLKPSFDKACTEGLNLLVWHAFVCSPEEEGLPGIQYFAGTHLNPNVTWWEKSKPFFDYINRCQFMLQQGLFVADVACYYGAHVPNFAQLKSSDPLKLLPGYDYDVVTSEVLVEGMSVQDGRLVLPDGMNYRVLALRDLSAVSLPVLRKLKEFLAAGATVVGARPGKLTTLTGYPQCDQEFAQLVNALWPPAQSEIQNLKSEIPKGRVIADRTAREVLLAKGVKPDFELPANLAPDVATNVDYLHRRDGHADIYFVANRSTNAITLDCTFRVVGKAPELWNAVSGERRLARAYEEKDGRTVVPLDFAPCGSWFVLFREPAAQHPRTLPDNRPKAEPLAELSGPWTAHFPIGWSADVPSDREMLSSGTRSVVFDRLTSWTERPEPGIKFYSGAATYENTFDLPPSAIANRQSPILLDLGAVRELAEVRVNGQSCGIVWAPPFRVNITRALKPGTNTLAVDVVNFWPNRIIGDATLPEAQRRTQTNIRKLTKDTALMPSGLFGPVRLLTMP